MKNNEYNDVICVIPARGGSKSIPKKNIQLLCGKPLIQYSVEYSIKCSLVTSTVVSTDSEEIAEIARDCGAKVQFMRPVELAHDDTPDYPVIRHALDTLEKLNDEIIDTLNKTTHIYISHEHPDHFNTSFFLNENFKRVLLDRKIEILFQNTKDKRKQNI